MVTQQRSFIMFSGHRTAELFTARSYRWLLFPLLLLLILPLASTHAPAQAQSTPQPVLTELGGHNLLTEVNGTYFFTASNATNSGLWKGDGTEEGSIFLNAISPAPVFLTNSYLKNIFINDMYFFIADDGTHGEEFWVSDGTPAGTILLKDINPGANSFFSGSYYSSSFIVSNNRLFFVADDGTHGEELWVSDGTPAGTVLVKDIYPGGNPSSPGNLTSFNDTIFFTADDGTHGTELWKTDGTAAGTVLAKDVYPGGNPSSPKHLTSFNDTLFFIADDGIHGRELWGSDGTETGTLLLKDLVPGAAGSNFISLGLVHVVFNNTFLFLVEDEAGGDYDLWTSDGTPEGTTTARLK
jgi:ELWxxDGT repeat protein